MQKELNQQHPWKILGDTDEEEKQRVAISFHNPFDRRTASLNFPATTNFEDQLNQVFNLDAGEISPVAQDIKLPNTTKKPYDTTPKLGDNNQRQRLLTGDDQSNRLFNRGEFMTMVKNESNSRQQQNSQTKVLDQDDINEEEESKEPRMIRGLDYDDFYALYYYQDTQRDTYNTKESIDNEEGLPLTTFRTENIT